MNNDGYGAIRVSYSILSAWASGNIDRAVAPYAGVEIAPTEAMEYGKKMHGIWERYARKYKALPKIFGGRRLENAKFELDTKRVRKLTDWCVVSGILDIKDGTTGIDYKTGKATATDYVNSKQPEVYQVLYPDLKRFEFYCKNQHVHHTDKSHITVGVVYLNRKTLEDGLNWILTMAAELREYLINNGYGDRLDQGKGLE